MAAAPSPIDQNHRGWWRLRKAIWLQVCCVTRSKIYFYEWIFPENLTNLHSSDHHYQVFGEICSSVHTSYSPWLSLLVFSVNASFYQDVLCSYCVMYCIHKTHLGYGWIASRSCLSLEWSGRCSVRRTLTNFLYRPNVTYCCFATFSVAPFSKFIPRFSRVSLHFIFKTYRVGQKKYANVIYTWLRQILSDFQNSFTVTFSWKFAIKLLLNIPPHLKHVATLPCEILMSAN